MKIFNTLTKAKDEFVAVNNEVTMYTCGVTVYDHCHVGHARSLYVFEVMRRYLAHKGYRVSFVRNITDVDDKIIEKARNLASEKKITLKAAFDEVRNIYIDSYYSDLKSLAIPEADIEPKATDNIEEMIAYIEKLIAEDFAYEAGGSVYFNVRNCACYGKLSGKKIDDLRESVRIDADTNKRDGLDFALWKNAKSDEPSWKSPWGDGRPGWHIECSVMSQKFLKTQTIDIHGGGVDLVFPHHENECAQSESYTGKPFARFWIHHGLLTINKQKMAKSLGNFITIREVVARYPADILKLLFLQAHYSSSVDFSWERMEEAKKAYERIIILRQKLENYFKGRTCSLDESQSIPLWDEFIRALDDDFNMPRALAALFDAINQANAAFESEKREKDTVLLGAQVTIERAARIFAWTFELADANLMSDEEIAACVRLRADHKINKNYSEADRIRKELEDKGILLEDTKDKTTWRRKL